MNLCGFFCKFWWFLGYDRRQSPESQPWDQKMTKNLKMAHNSVTNGLENWATPPTLENKTFRFVCFFEILIFFGFSWKFWWFLGHGSGHGRVAQPGAQKYQKIWKSDLTRAQWTWKLGYLLNSAKEKLPSFWFYSFYRKFWLFPFEDSLVSFP